MEKNIKPIFNEEIKAEIITTGSIEENISKLKDYAIELANYYSTIVFNEEEVKTAKNEKAEVNKFKKKVSDLRKQVIAKYNEPIKMFEQTAKETEAILSNVYDGINVQIAEYEDKTKKEKEDKLRDYFKELCSNSNIDFLTFENANVNVTLSASEKSLKEALKSFVEKVTDDLILIDTQNYKEEIFVEYKKTLNVSRSIQEVTERHLELESMKAEQQSLITDKEMLEKVEEKLSAPSVEDMTVYEMKFTVHGTKQQLKDLKEYLMKEGLINE